MGRLHAKTLRAVLALIVVSGGAGAATAGLELAWSAPPGCPTEAEFVAAVEQTIGARDAKLRRPLWAQVTVVEREGRFRLELSWRTASEQAVRSVDGDTCAELSQAAVLIIALAADPAADQAPGVVAEPSAPAVAVAAEPAPSQVVERQPPRSVVPSAAPTSDRRNREAGRAGRVRLSGRVAGALELGTLPRPSPGGLLGAQLSLPPGALVLDVLTFVPVEREVSAGAGRFWLSALSLRPCWTFSAGKLRAQPCAAAEAHVIQSQGRKLADRDDRWAWFLRFGLTAEASYRLGPSLSLLFGGALLAAPSRPRFVIGREVRVHEPAPVAGRITLGFELWP